MLNWLFHLIHRHKPLSADAHNVVVSICKAKALYKELIVTAHPDKNPNNKKEAEEITRLLNQHRRDYGMLLQLKQRIDNEL